MLGLLIGYPFELSSYAIGGEEKKLVREHPGKKGRDEAIAVCPRTICEKYKTFSIYEFGDAIVSGAAEANPRPSDRRFETPAQ